MLFLHLTSNVYEYFSENNCIGLQWAMFKIRMPSVHNFNKLKRRDIKTLKEIRFNSKAREAKGKTSDRTDRLVCTSEMWIWMAFGHKTWMNWWLYQFRYTFCTEQNIHLSFFRIHILSFVISNWFGLCHLLIPHFIYVLCVTTILIRAHAFHRKCFFFPYYFLLFLLSLLPPYHHLPV